MPLADTDGVLVAPAVLESHVLARIDVDLDDVEFTGFEVQSVGLSVESRFLVVDLTPGRAVTNPAFGWAQPLDVLDDLTSMEGVVSDFDDFEGDLGAGEAIMMLVLLRPEPGVKIPSVHIRGINYRYRGLPFQIPVIYDQFYVINLPPGEYDDRHCGEDFHRLSDGDPDTR